MISAFDAKKAKRKSFFLHRDPSQSRMDPKASIHFNIISGQPRTRSILDPVSNPAYEDKPPLVQSKIKLITSLGHWGVFNTSVLLLTGGAYPC